jgi:hypothetical protein
MTMQIRWIAVPVAVLCLCSHALAIDMPKRKSGLWEIKLVHDRSSRPAQTMQMCIDQKTDDMAQQMGANVAKQACSKQDIRREGSRIVGDSICKIGETTATSHSVFSGAFDQSYRGEIRTQYAPPLMGKSETTTVIEARWIGPCAADQKPGDMIMPNGMKININQMSGKQ